jgi:hypothetical protein
VPTGKNDRNNKGQGSVTRYSVLLTRLLRSEWLAFLHDSEVPPTNNHAEADATSRGFPAPDEVQRRYDEADLNRAVQAYRFFYATVSGAAILKGNAEVGVVDNKVCGQHRQLPRVSPRPRPTGSGGLLSLCAFNSF